MRIRKFGVEQPQTEWRMMGYGREFAVISFSDGPRNETFKWELSVISCKKESATIKWRIPRH